MRDLRRKRLGDRLDDDTEGPGLGHRAGICEDRLPILLLAPLRPEAAEHIHRLRCKPHMRHHRHAALDEKANCRRHAHAAFELHRAAAGLAHHPRAGLKRPLRRGLIGAERHVHHHKRLLRRAHHRLPVQDHHLKADRHGGRQAMQHHPERIADQQQVTGLIRQPRRDGVIGGEANDRGRALPCADIGSGETLGEDRLGHGGHSGRHSCQAVLAGAADAVAARERGKGRARNLSDRIMDLKSAGCLGLI